MASAWPSRRDGLYGKTRHQTQPSGGADSRHVAHHLVPHGLLPTRSKGCMGGAGGRQSCLHFALCHGARLPQSVAEPFGKTGGENSCRSGGVQLPRVQRQCGGVGGGTGAEGAPWLARQAYLAAVARTWFVVFSG